MDSDSDLAFPAIEAITKRGLVRGVPGMSMRDYFAGQALAAISADLQRNQEYGAAINELAAKAYVIADAMLKERNHGPA